MRVTSKGQVTIPKAVRERLGIRAGTEVEFVERETDVVLEKRVNASETTRTNFDSWAASVAGTIDTMGMDGKAYVDWLRGPREDLDPG